MTNPVSIPVLKRAALLLALGVTNAFAVVDVGVDEEEPQVLVDNTMLSNEADGTNWASYGRTFSENHFSPLNQINDGNVDRLGLEWYYDLPNVMSTFTAPLVVNGVMYFAIHYSIVYAMDATNGQVLWTYDSKAAQAAGKKLRAGWGIRGVAFWGDKVITGTHDGRLIALDSRTGKEVWSVMTIDKDDGRYITSPPWVFNGKVMIGFGGADFEPDRGYVTAYDAETGKQVWRFFIVPGNPADGFEDEAMEMAAKTWSGEWWRFGGAGGHAWGAMAFDPKYNNVYIGTGNGTPWNEKIRSPEGGDNLFIASIVALDADTGKYKWHYQTNPGDVWDYDASIDMELATIELDGEPRDVMLHASKNGFFYVIDRKDGRLLSAEKYVEANWAERIDMETGRPVETDMARFKEGGPVLVTPSPLGGHNIQAMSYSPVTGLAYIPRINLWYVFADAEGNLTDWKPHLEMGVNTGLSRPKHNFKIPRPSSSLMAWDPVKQKVVWDYQQTAPINGGTAATAGNLVFQGRANGEFAAYTADKGEKVWTYDAQDAGIEAHPITYMVDGKQYVTIFTGFRGMGSYNGVDPEWDYFLQQRRIMTFALDGKAKLPPPGPRVAPFVDDPDFVVDAAKAEHGRKVYDAHCWLCHGKALKSGGTATDLRKSQKSLSINLWKAILHRGALIPKGMPDYQEFTEEDIEGLRHYVGQEARQAIAAEKASAGGQ